MLQSSLNKMDGADAIKGLSSLDPKSNPIFGAFAMAYSFVVSAGAVPVRVFLRRNIGERSFSPAGFVISLAFYFFYFGLWGGLILGSMQNKYLWVPEFPIAGFTLLKLNFFLNPFLLFLVIVFFKGVQHFKRLIREAQHNQTGYSYYRGDGIYFRKKLGKKKWGFQIDERFMRMVVEPLAAFRLGFIIFFIAGGIVTINILYFVLSDPLKYTLIFLMWLSVLGIAVMFSSLCLFLDEFGIMMRIRGSVLDLIDSEIDMKILLKKKAEISGESLNLPEGIIEKVEASATPLTQFISMADDAGVASFPEQ